MDHKNFIIIGTGSSQKEIERHLHHLELIQAMAGGKHLAVISGRDRFKDPYPYGRGIDYLWKLDEDAQILFARSGGSIGRTVDARLLEKDMFPKQAEPIIDEDKPKPYCNNRHINKKQRKRKRRLQSKSRKSK